MVHVVVRAILHEFTSGLKKLRTFCEFRYNFRKTQNYDIRKNWKVHPRAGVDEEPNRSQTLQGQGVHDQKEWCRYVRKTVHIRPLYQLESFSIRANELENTKNNWTYCLSYLRVLLSGAHITFFNHTLPVNTTRELIPMGLTSKSKFLVSRAILIFDAFLTVTV